MSDELTTVEIGNLDLFEIPTAQGPIPVGVDEYGTIFLSGHLHPAGAAGAMVLAEKAGIPWVPLGAVDALFPAKWLGEAAIAHGDNFRIVAIGQIERYVRNRG